MRPDRYRQLSLELLELLRPFASAPSRVEKASYDDFYVEVAAGGSEAPVDDLAGVLIAPPGGTLSPSLAAGAARAREIQALVRERLGFGVTVGGAREARRAARVPAREARRRRRDARGGGVGLRRRL